MSYSKYREKIERLGINVKESMAQPLKGGREITGKPGEIIKGPEGTMYSEIKPGVYSPVTLHIPHNDIGIKGRSRFDKRDIELMDNNQFDDIKLVKKFHRYHFTHCRIVDDFFTTGLKNKFYTSDSWCGKFKYIITKEGKELLNTSEQRLLPCGYCLRLLRGGNGPSYQAEHFDIKKARNKYINNLPINHQREESTLPEIYPKDWKVISRTLREKANWICDECGKNYSDNKKDLHVHHINHKRNDNRRVNLKVLCHSCHSNYHAHM